MNCSKEASGSTKPGKSSVEYVSDLGAAKVQFPQVPHTFQATQSAVRDSCASEAKLFQLRQIMQMKKTSIGESSAHHQI